MEPDHQAGAQAIAAVAVVLWLTTTAGGFAVGGLEMAAGVAVGGALALVNFQLLRRWSARALGLEPKPPSGLVMTLRWTGTAAVLALALWVVDVSPVGLLLGLSTIVAAVVVAAALGLVRG